MAKYIYTRDIIAQSLLNDGVNEEQSAISRINVLTEFKNYSNDGRKKDSDIPTTNYNIIAEALDKRSNVIDHTNDNSKKKKYYDKSLNDIKLLNDQIPEVTFPKNYRIYSMTLKNKESSAYSIVCDVCNLLIQNSSCIENLQLVMFSIPDISNLDTLNKVIKFQSETIEKLNNMCKYYIKWDADLCIGYRRIKIAKIQNLESTLEHNIDILKKTNHNIIYFFINTTNNSILNNLDLVLELYFYRQLETINNPKVFIVMDNSLPEKHNSHLVLLQKTIASLKKFTIYDDLCRLCESNSNVYKLSELEWNINKKTDNNNNISASITTKISEIDFEAVVEKNTKRKICKDETFYYRGNNKCITIFENKFLINKDAKKKTQKILKVLKIITKFDTYFLHYNYSIISKKKDKKTIEIQLYDDILHNPISFIYKLKRYGKNNESKKNLMFNYLEMDRTLRKIIRNLVTNLIEIHDKHNIILQDFYVSYLFDGFLFNVKSLVNFKYDHNITVENLENLLEEYRHILNSKLPYCKIELENVNFMFGSDQFIKKHLNIPYVEKNKLRPQFGFENLCLDSSILNFIKNHVRYIRIGYFNSYKICFLYKMFQIYRFKISKDNCSDDYFFVILINGSEALCSFETRFKCIIKDDKKLGSYFKDAEHLLSALDRNIDFIYTVEGKECIKEIYLFEKTKNIYFHLKLLWQQFVDFTGSELIYIIIQGKIYDYLKASYINYEYELPSITLLGSDEKLHAKGHFELNSLISALNIIFMHLRRKIFLDIETTCIADKNYNNHVIFMSQNINTENLKTYINIYDNEISKSSRGVLAYHTFY
ncbi:hypothetical protein COBT_000642 [Conglomerata obtusa]